jgi:hypothetical protein
VCICVSVGMGRRGKKLYFKFIMKIQLKLPPMATRTVLTLATLGDLAQLGSFLFLYCATQSCQSSTDLSLVLTGLKNILIFPNVHDP